LLTSVDRELHQTVVGARPDQILLHRRFYDRKNRVVDFHAGNVFCDGSAGGLLFLLVVARQGRADDVPAHPAVGCLEQDFARKIQSLRIVGRKRDGFGPLESVFYVGSGPTDRIYRPGIDAQCFAGAVVVAGDLAAVGTGINNFWIARIRSDITAFAATDVVPVGAIDSASGTGARDANCGIVLLRAVDVVGEAVVRSDVVELRSRLIVLRGPRFGAVGRDSCAAVISVDQAVGICRVDPQTMIVAVGRVNRGECPAAVVRTIRRGVQ